MGTATGSARPPSTVALVAGGEVREGSEVVINYGRKSNEQLLVRFAEEEEEFEEEEPQQVEEPKPCDEPGCNRLAPEVAKCWDCGACLCAIFCLWPMAEKPVGEPA